MCAWGGRWWGQRRRQQGGSDRVCVAVRAVVVCLGSGGVCCVGTQIFTHVHVLLHTGLSCLL